MQSNYTTLAIIGNGFDLAHGYDTTYRSFVDRTQSEVLDEFRQMCDNEGITTWYDFENNIKELSLNLYQKAVMGSDAPEAYDTMIARANDVFKKLHDLLAAYLKAETMKQYVRKLRSIRRFISRHTILINFNYTSTPEAYSGDVFYVHGSLAEDNILLGYDYRDEPCLIGMDFMYWSKKYRRELMAFQRHIKADGSLSAERIANLSDNFEHYQDCANAPRGIDEELQAEIGDFEFIDSFVQNDAPHMIYTDIDYSKIKKVAVMGHGIEADREFLALLLGSCTNLKKIILYTYSGEPQTSIAQKISFLQPFCKKLVVRKY